jgi:acetylornithine deacetylase/succinyl-diaminopimelate desuccinylase-like protein
MRIAPGADGDHELGILMDFLRRNVPWQAAVDVEKFHAFSGFMCPAGGAAYAAAETAMEKAFGRPVHAIGAGGSIPLVRTLHQAVPDAEFVLWGSEDMAGSSIHGPNESVDLAELERMCLAEALFLQLLGESR